MQVKVKDCVAVPKSKKLLQFTLDDGTGTDRTILSGIHIFYDVQRIIEEICNIPLEDNVNFQIKSTRTIMEVSMKSWRERKPQERILQS